MAKRIGACRALLNAPMREGHEGDVDIQDVRKPVFQTLLYFTYTDQLPEVLSLMLCCTQDACMSPVFCQAHPLAELKYSSIGWDEGYDIPVRSKQRRCQVSSY